MKKIIIIILSFLFLLSLSLPAFASSAGVGAVLTLDEVAASVLAAFGVAVPVASLPANFGQAMLDTIAAAAGPGLDSQAVSQAVQSWADLAVQGTIQIASALPWIQTGVKDFVESAPDTVNSVPEIVDSGGTVTTNAADGKVVSFSVIRGPVFGYSVAWLNGRYHPSTGVPLYDGWYGVASSSGSYSVSPATGSSRYFTDGSSTVYYNLNQLTGYPVSSLSGFLIFSNSSSAQSWLLSVSSGTVSTSVAVGGIQAVLPEYGLSGVSVPDLSIAAAAAAGGITASVFANNAIEQLHNGTLPWVTYVGTVAGGASATIAIPGTAVDALGNTIAVTSTYALVESGLGALLSSVAASPEIPVVPEPGEFQMDLTEFFPFCIPFDLYKLFSALNAMPQAPVFDWPIPLPGGSTYNLHVDLTPFDSVASVVRTMELLAFCIALALRTRELIRG